MRERWEATVIPTVTTVTKQFGFLRWNRSTDDIIYCMSSALAAEVQKR